MKKISVFILLFVLSLGFKIQAQNLNTWRISVGYSNFSKSDDNLIGNHYSNFNNFNFPNTLSIEKKIHNNFSFKFSGTVNEFEKITSIQTLTVNQKTDFFLGLDIALKYSLMGEKGKSTWFNPFITGGIGYSKFDNFGAPKLTAGIGSNFWIKKNFGFQIGSSYNKSVELEGSNYLNHYVGFIVLFNRNIKTDFVENNLDQNLLTKQDQKTTNDEKVSINTDKIKSNDNNLAESNKVASKKVETKKSKTQKEIKKNKDKNDLSISKTSEKDKSLTMKDPKSVKEDNITPNEVALVAKVEESTIKTNTKFENSIKDKEIEVQKTNESIEDKTTIEVKSPIEQENIRSLSNDLKTEKVSDSDGDKVPDMYDKCPNVFGEISNAGCPKKPELASTNNAEVSKVQNESNDTTSNFEDNKSILKATNIYFETDSDKILDDERSKIHMIIYILEKNPNASIIVEGHTAKDGDVDYNKKLSENRAKAVRQYLINKGISANKIVTKSLGSAQPVSTDSSEKTKAMNRRARIILVK